MKKKLKIGDRVEITAVDHTTSDKGWEKPADLIRGETPANLSVIGYYLGEEKNIIHLAMGRCEDTYGTKWMIPTKTVLKIHKLR